MKTGMRREMLDRDLTGTKKLLGEVLWPVFGSFDAMELEYELISITGVKVYADVFHRMMRTVFEADGYVSHAENITRDRFSFEKTRIRTFATYGYKYVPFSWDQLDKSPEACKRSVFELLGRFGNANGSSWFELPVYEREIIRCAMVHPGPFRLNDACGWLQLGQEATRKVVRNLVTRRLLKMEGGSEKRSHLFRLTDNARDLL
ncbi:MAG: hypothetical protein JWR03_927 [Cohnella sp.]|nr:hypothetical protein [Cohnella sp.]